MATELHTFIDIFNSEIEVGEEQIKLQKIVIPIIQRDYAQGRKEEGRVRERFLNSLYKAVTGLPVTLDFVYGDIDNNGVMTPLDGQQRLTTLFLLHWYAAKKDFVPREDYSFLNNFSYETRYSARYFCSYLISFEPSFNNKISDEIIDQAWFPLDWKKDATIRSMLVMIDAIHEKFGEVPDLWSALSNRAVSFYFLPIRDMGLTDELYIKMNSRGKPLTSFEHFKAELERELKKIDSRVSERIIRKIDIDWTDMLWQYRGEDNITDDEFLRYFRFICDIICYKQGGTSQGKSQDEFDLLKMYFSRTSENVMENIALLEEYFDIWCPNNLGTNPSEFLTKFIALEHKPGMVMFENNPDLFHDCLRDYADIIGNRNRKFPLNRIIMLYAFVVYLINKSTVDEDSFRRRLRIVHNLVRNSEDEISDSESRTAGNRMPAILRQVDSIITTGIINDAESSNFNSYQLSEETLKQEWLAANSDKAEALFKVEDTDLLKGQIAILGLENYGLFSKFEDLMQCDKNDIDCALLSVGDYKQCDRNGWRYQLGSKSLEKPWITLFHKSANSGFETTKEVLISLLGRLDTVSNDNLKRITQNYISECESNSLYEWRYYYIKYDCFRPGRYGKYSWDDTDNGYYDMHLLWTESQWSQNSYQPFLYAADSTIISRDDSGHVSIRNGQRIECKNSGFIFSDAVTHEPVHSIDVKRNEDGIDVEDRIVLLKNYLECEIKE